MKYIQVSSYDELSEKAAEMISAQMREKKDSVLGLATGATPVGTYEKLVKENKQKKVDFSKAITFNLDEYVGVDGNNEQSYRYFMNKQLFSRINISLDNTFVPNGKAEDLEEECQEYEDKITKAGGIDFQLLGIGHNGHIGFNEPGEMFIKNTHIVRLGEPTRKANARFFSSIDEVPTQAITVGMKTITHAKKVLLLVNGKEKENIVKKALYGPITPEIPASILQLHPDLTVICCFD